MTTLSRSLRLRVVLSTSVAIGGLLLALGLLGIGVIRQATTSVLDERLRTAELLAARLDTDLAADMSRIHFLTETGIRASPTGTPMADSDLIDRLDDHLSILSAGLLLLDRQGKVISTWPARLFANANTLLSQPKLQEAIAQGTPTVTGLLKTAEGTPVSAFVQPLVPSTSGDGFLVGLVDLRSDKLQNVLMSGLPSGRTAHAVLVDETGTVLTATEQGMAFTRGEHPETLKKLVRAGRKVVMVTDNKLTEPHVIAAAPLKQVTWIVSLGQEEAEAMAPVTGLQWQFILFGLAAVAIAAAYAWWDTGAVTSPLASLTDAARQVAAGNLNAEVHVERQDELGILAGAFRTMQLRLKEAMTTLEKTLGETRLREQETDALYRVSRDILSSLDLTNILQTVVDQARSLVGADVAILCLLRDPPDDAYVAACSDPGGLLGGVDTEDLSARSTDACGCCPLPLMSGATEHRSVPLTVSNRVIGNLCVAGSGLPTEASSLRLLEGLANQATIAIENARLYEHTQVLAVYEERERIARELHDSVAQTLGYIYSRARLLQDHTSQESDPTAWADLDDLARVASATYDEVRWAIFGLRKSQQESTEVLSTLVGFLRDFTTRYGIRAELEGEALGRLAIEPRAEAQLVRIVQEALTNAGKHSRASHVWVRIEDLGERFLFTVEDDGIGFDPLQVAANTGAFGLISMRERAESVGGQLEVDSARGSGTRVRLWLPPYKQGR